MKGNTMKRLGMVVVILSLAVTAWALPSPFVTQENLIVATSIDNLGQLYDAAAHQDGGLMLQMRLQGRWRVLPKGSMIYPTVSGEIDGNKIVRIVLDDQHTTVWTLLALLKGYQNVGWWR